MSHIQKLHPKAALIIVTIFILFLFAPGLNASSPVGNMLKADCSVEIIGDPKLNEPFEVVFSFTPDNDLIHTKGIPDTARIRVGGAINFVSGDTLWTGFLEKGETNFMRAWLVVSDSIKFRIKGKVIAMQALGIWMSVGNVPDPGVRARNGAGSRIINLTGRSEDVFIWNKPIIDPVDSTVLYFVKDTIPISHFSKPIKTNPPPENESQQSR